MGAGELVRVTSPHFVAGVIVGQRAAPIVRYMKEWPRERIERYCRTKNWRCETITTPTVFYRSLAFLGYAGYKVGSDGSVWKVQGGLKKRLKTTGGYERVVVNLPHASGRRGTKNVAHLVLEAFVGPRPPGMVCCHYDGNVDNSELSNLRWDTYSGNERDKERHGTGNQGVRNRAAKLTPEIVRRIRALYATGEYSMSQLCRRFGITLGTIHPLLHRKTWPNV